MLGFDGEYPAGHAKAGFQNIVEWILKQIYIFNLCFAAFDLLPSNQDMFTVPL